MSMSKEKKSKKPKDIVDELTEEVDDLNIGNSDGEDTKQGGDQTPENKSKRNETEKGARKKLSFSPGVNKGELVEGDPWDSTPMRDKVDESSVYTVSNEWKTSGKVDLGKIYQKLPAFVNKIRGKTCRQELEEILKKANGGLVTTNILQNPSPHVKEIVDKQRPKDKPSLPKGEKESF